jgi:superfamily II DNA or RNA helicase
MKYIKHLRGTTWEHVIAAKWWPNQSAALQVVSDYLDSNSDQQAMIRMPTGTGKTVVIATLAQLLRDYKNVLIVAPWEALVEQLRREVSSNLWEKVRESQSLVPRSTELFTPTTLSRKLKNLGDAGVLICTNQTLQALRKSNSGFNRLQQWASLVLIDEGHREPAPQWAEAVRDLQRPTILFTATPYRNDLRLFDVSDRFFYSYTFVDAIDDNLVRDVDFIDGLWPRDSASTIGDFVRKLIETRKYAEKESGVPHGAMRVIVRCNEADDIKAIAREIESRGESVIGVHERFMRRDGSIFRRDVPDPKDEQAHFWVHQYKLLEGLDDPAFRLVALFHGFPNARNLVQQVGRVIRNPDRQPAQKAFVLAHREDRQRDLWRRFIDYEENVRDRNINGQSELAIFDDFIASFANAPRFYFLGDFRKDLRASDIKDPREIVLMRKSVLVRISKPSFDWNKLMSNLRHELLTGDFVPFGKGFQHSDSFLQLFVVFEQSDLVSEAYLQNRLGYTFAARIGQRIFFYDSEGRNPEYLKRSTTSILPEMLHRLLPDTRTTIREVSLINGDFGNHAFRRRIVSTESLQGVPPALSDYVQVCSTATGSVRPVKTGEARRRYVGFTRGRLSERTTPIVDYPGFMKWLGSVDAALDDKTVRGDDTLERFARPHKYVPTEEPRHILFDITSEELDTSKMDDSVAPLDPDKYWLIRDGSFCGEIDDKVFEARLSVNPETERFEIESDALEQVAMRQTRKTFTAYLNETQNFRILLGASTVYTQGSFFTPNLLPWKGGGNRLNIQRIVAGCAGLRGVTSEKGDLNGWHGSVFGAIVDKSQVFRAANWMPDILVCNDVGNPEMADFLAFSEKPKRLVMIHGKFAKPSKNENAISASAFHEICSQAVRYLGFFNPTDQQTALTSAKILADWCPDKEKFGREKRIVWANRNDTATKIVKKFNDATEDPTFVREVWLVMGNGLSEKAFQQAVAKVTPRPNEREASYLFQSTWCAVASVGASLRVFCMP